MATAHTDTLRTPDDYISWDKLRVDCELIEGLSSFEKKKAARAFQLLEAKFGTGFLRTAFAAGHPMMAYIANRAPWTRKWLIWFAEAVQEAEAWENSQSLVDRLTDEARFEEGLSVLETGHKLSRAGFALSIEPRVDISGRTKVPDLKISDPDSEGELFLEISIQGDSEGARESNAATTAVVGLLISSGPSIRYSGRLHKTPAPRHLDEILEKIKTLIQASKREGTFRELAVPDAIDLAVAPENDTGILQEWAGEKGVKVNEFWGPPYVSNDVLRTKRKIRIKQAQLPTDYPNMVVVKGNALFLGALDVRSVINELEEEVYRYPHLLAAVLYGGHLGMREETCLMKGQHLYICKTYSDSLIEHHIIILNRYCKTQIYPATISKLYNAFRNF